MTYAKLIRSYCNGMETRAQFPRNGPRDYIYSKFTLLFHIANNTFAKPTFHWLLHNEQSFLRCVLKQID